MWGRDRLKHETDSTERDTTQSLEKGGNQRQCNMDEEKLP